MGLRTHQGLAWGRHSVRACRTWFSYERSLNACDVKEGGFCVWAGHVLSYLILTSSLVVATIIVKHTEVRQLARGHTEPGPKPTFFP